MGVFTFNEDDAGEMVIGQPVLLEDTPTGFGLQGSKT
jgi:hypothetical protein